MSRSKKSKVYCKEELAKTQALKGSVRSNISYDMIHNMRAVTIPDGKQKAKSRNIKHKGRGYDLY